MLFNKSNVRKASEKKVLHKVGKNWKVVSMALLMAIGGGAVATHANANADATGNAEANDVAGTKYINGNTIAPQKQTSSSVSNNAKRPASNISYLSGYNGSAASYHADAQNDEVNYQSNNKIVNSYVDSLNAKFPKQTSSLNNNYNSAADQVKADKSNASSYSAIAAQSNHSSQVSTLASKAGLTYSGFVQSVSYMASSYASAVSEGSSVVSEASYVNSYAQLISNIDNNSGLKNEYKVNANSANASYEVVKAYTNNENGIYNDLLKDSASNENAFNSAASGSAANSAAEEIAHINSGRDAATTNSLANSLGYHNTSSETSSENSSNAVSFVDNKSYAYTRSDGSTVDVLASSNNNNGKNTDSVNADNMSVLLKDTAAMQSYGSESAEFNSEMTSASVARASLAGAVASASAALQSDNYALNSAQDVKQADDILAGGNLQEKDLFGSVVYTNGTSGTKSGVTTTFNDIAKNIDANINTDKGVTSAVSVAFKNANDAKAVANVIVAYHKFDGGNANTAVSNVQKFLNSFNNINTAKGVQSAYLNSNDNGILMSVVGGLSAYDSSATSIMGNASDNNLPSDVHSLANAFNTLANYKHTTTHTTPGKPAGSYFDGKGLLNPASYSALTDNTTIDHFLDNNVASDASAINSMTDSVANSYGNEQSASASYSAAVNENVTLAGIYATSYSDDAISEENVASAAKNSLDSFYADHADAKYANASSAASSASAAYDNDTALAHANGLHVYNYGPKYITVTDEVQLHSATDFNKKNIIGSIPKGTQLNVDGVGFGVNGLIRYTVNYKGQKGYVTAYPGYTEYTFAPVQNNVSVTVNRPARVYKNASFSKYAGETIPAGSTVTNVSIVTIDNINGGFTRVESNDGNAYFTSNTKYITVNRNAATNNNNNGNNSIDGNHLVSYFNSNN